MKVLKFGATWCPTCIIMKPRWDEIEQELPWLETEFYDADESESVLERYEVDELPTFVFLDSEGQEIKRMIGEVSKDKLIEVVQELRDK